MAEKTSGKLFHFRHKSREVKLAGCGGNGNILIHANYKIYQTRYCLPVYCLSKIKLIDY